MLYTAVALKTPLCSALEIKWNAINLKCGNKLSSCDVDFYSQGLKLQGSQMKLYIWNKSFLGLFSEVICTQFMEDAHLLCVVCAVFDFPH